MATSLLAQTPGGPADDRTWKAWAAAARTHVPGQIDAPVRALAVWTRAELLAAVAALPRNDPDARGVVARALILHTDIAIGHRTPTGYALPPTPRASILLADGREYARMLGTYHWEIARRALERLPGGEDRTRMARLFYRGTAAALQAWGDNAELELHLREAARVIEDDPVLLLYEGTKHQLYASSRFQLFLAARRSSDTGGPLPVPIPGTGQTGLPTNYRRSAASGSEGEPAAVERRRAETLFRRALDRDAALVEARIRLAHMLLERDRFDDASRELRQASSAPLPPFLAYYASLLAGRVELAGGRHATAREAFERAASLYPDAQSPRFALSLLAVIEGRHRDALEYLPAGSTSEARTGDDPWMLLHRAHEPSADRLLDEMRRELSR